MKKTAPPPQTTPRKNSAEHAVPRGSARRRVAENGGAIFKIVPLHQHKPLCLNKHTQCYVLYHVLILGREAPQYNYVIKYITLLVFI